MLHAVCHAGGGQEFAFDDHRRRALNVVVHGHLARHLNLLERLVGTVNGHEFLGIQTVLSGPLGDNLVLAHVQVVDMVAAINRGMQAFGLAHGLQREVGLGQRRPAIVTHHRDPAKNDIGGFLRTPAFDMWR